MARAPLAPLVLALLAIALLSAAGAGGSGADAAHGGRACLQCGASVHEAVPGAPAGSPAARAPAPLGSCAVVLPSSLLLRFRHGAEIDAHDATFRMNLHDGEAGRCVCACAGAQARRG